MNDEVERMVATSFLLGLRISQSINNLPPPDQIRYAALVETLEEVAAGDEVTLEADPDQKRLRPASVEFDALLSDFTHLQREIAKTVLQRLLR